MNTIFKISPAAVLFVFACSMQAGEQQPDLQVTETPSPEKIARREKFRQTEREKARKRAILRLSKDAQAILLEGDVMHISSNGDVTLRLSSKESAIGNAMAFRMMLMQKNALDGLLISDDCKCYRSMEDAVPGQDLLRCTIKGLDLSNMKDVEEARQTASQDYKNE